MIGAFGTVTKGLLKGLEDLEVGDRVETIQTTALLETARILRRVLETWGDLLSLNLQWVNNNNNKKRIWKIVDFAVPADDRIKLKDCEKKDKYLDLARELKKLWNMQVTTIPIVIGAFRTVTKRLSKGLEDLEVGRQVETIQTPTEYWEESWRLEICCHSISSERPSAYADMKKTLKSKW